MPRRGGWVLDRRGWTILVLSASLLALVFVKAQRDSSVDAPPASDPPAIDLVVPATRPVPADSATRLAVSIGVKGCGSPATVVVRFGAAQPGVMQSWLTRRSRISFGVSSDAVSGFRVFVGRSNASTLSELVAGSFAGNALLREVARSDGTGLVEDPKSRGVDYGPPTKKLRGIAGFAPAVFSPAGQPPEIIVVFKARWLTRRSFATCYLKLPQVPSPVGNALLPIPGPPRLAQTLGYDDVEVAVDDSRFDGNGPAPLEVDTANSSPRPTNPAVPVYSCTGAEPSCSGGYLALSSPNAEGKTSARLILLSAILGLLAAILAEQLIHLKWQGQRYFRT